MDTTDNTTKTLVAEHRECIIEAAVEIFGSTCGLQIQETDNSEEINQDGVILAVISLVGDVEWSVFLGLPRDTASAIAAKFAGFEIPFESEDMGDAVGELTNIFAGEIKNRLDKKGLKAEISLPSVMRAESMEVLIQHSATTDKICFSTDNGKFWTGMTVGKNAGFVG